MGLFDYVEYTAPCWRCGTSLTSWQSKDADCEMTTVRPSDVLCFYTSCQKCGAWNQFDRVFTDRFERNEQAQKSDASEEP